MTNSVKTELKMMLFDNISKAKDSIDIVGTKMETEYFFGLCERVSDVDGISDSNKNMLIKANVHDVISAYYLRPDLDFENRIPFVKGVLFAANLYPALKCDPKFQQLSIETKLAVLIMKYDLGMKSNNPNMAELFNIHNGIAMELELFELGDNKNNNGQKRKK